jgi:hypothetical protein
VLSLLFVNGGVLASELITVVNSSHAALNGKSLNNHCVCLSVCVCAFVTSFLLFLLPNSRCPSLPPLLAVSDTLTIIMTERAYDRHRNHPLKKLLLLLQLHSKIL